MNAGAGSYFRIPPEILAPLCLFKSPVPPSCRCDRHPAKQAYQRTKRTYRYPDHPAAARQSKSCTWDWTSIRIFLQFTIFPPPLPVLLRNGYHHSGNGSKTRGNGDGRNMSNPVSTSSFRLCAKVRAIVLASLGLTSLSSQGRPCSRWRETMSLVVLGPFFRGSAFGSFLVVLAVTMITGSSAAGSRNLP